MDSSNIGLVIILGICALGLFAVWLSHRIRKDTGTEASSTDDALNYGRGNVAFSALAAETTGLSRVTMGMLTAVAVAIFSAGCALLYYHPTPGLALIGLGLVSVGSATVIRNGVSFFRAVSHGEKWVMFITRENAPGWTYGYYTLMSAGLILIVAGVIIEVMGYEQLSATQAAASVLIPIGVSVALGYWRVRKGSSPSLNSF